MSKILIFGGTTEGRKLCEICCENNIHAYVSTASEYGADLLKNDGTVTILTGRKDSTEIAELIDKKDIGLVFDATHPYALEITKNVKTACIKTGTEYVRVKRAESRACGKYFDNVASAAEYLNVRSGNILFTVGSKGLLEFSNISDFSERCAARVLPVDEAVLKCKALGIKSENIIAKQGPFTKEENIRHIKQYNVRFLVTKESGKTGGFIQKAGAAEECGVVLVVIKRPEENGVTFSQAEKLLTEWKNG